MTRKHWFGWTAVVVFAALCAVIFWPKSKGTRQKRAAAVQEPPASHEPPLAPPTSRPVAPPLVRAPAEALGATVAPSAPPTEADDSVPEQTELEKAQLARLPVIYAIRGDYPNDQARFDAMRGALQKSGRSTEAWTESASSTFERWGSALEGIERTVDTSSLRCYVAGCEVLVTFPDRATFEQGAAKFRSIPDQIPMGRVQTPGVSLPDGPVLVSWMLMRPDTAPPDAG
ncbi:MAG: hypothetical protein K0R38_2844 [Polyangiaceae bacterium]|nr:hypothetical protein [Polyangiaceae bacterium]